MPIYVLGTVVLTRNSYMESASLFGSTLQIHNTENSKQIFPEKELRGLSPTFMCLWAIYIFPGSVHIFSCSRISRPIVEIYKSLTDTWIWKLGLRQRNSFSGNICFKFLVLWLCSVDLILSTIQRRLQMQFSMARKFTRKASRKNSTNVMTSWSPTWYSTLTLVYSAKLCDYVHIFRQISPQ